MALPVGQVVIQSVSAVNGALKRVFPELVLTPSMERALEIGVTNAVDAALKATDVVLRSGIVATSAATIGGIVGGMVGTALAVQITGGVGGPVGASVGAALGTVAGEVIGSTLQSSLESLIE